MINHKTEIINNKCRITFDFSPKSITCSRKNYTATHIGGGTTWREGIWEGIWLEKAWVKIGDDPWIDYGEQQVVSIDVSDNNVQVKAKARYSLKTMGYHYACTNGVYPFFYFGNYGDDISRYSYGNFKDGSPSKPKSDIYNYVLVPKDWDYYSCEWVDWAYNHGKNTGNWAINNGRFEQRNSNYESARKSNGWTSDSGYGQISRKTCAFYFRKSYTDNATSYGVIKDTTTPKITVHPAKGNEGDVTVKYIDYNNAAGKLWLRAYCNGKQVDIDTFDRSGTFHNGGYWKYNINFDYWFGHEYEGNDVYYEAWAKNEYGKESPGTGRVGVQRYNGRPSIPTGLTVKGKNNIIYNDLTFNWNKSIDPDNDSVSYDIWIKTTSLTGYVIRDNIVANKINNTQYNYDISSDPDGCKYEIWIRATDNLLNSEWSTALSFKKGSKPNKTPILISPEIDNTNLYSSSPRFVFDNYDENCIFIVNINNEEYNNRDNSNYFSSEGNKIMFLTPKKYLNTTSIFIKAYLKNEYGISNISKLYKFNKLKAIDKIKTNEISEGYLIEMLQNYINDKAKSYNKHFNFTKIIPKTTYISCSIYNELVQALKDINDNINSILNNNTFDITMNSNTITSGTKNENKYWDYILDDINTI